MADTEEYMQRLTESDLLRESYLREAIQSLQLPEGSRGLDAGCGIGFQIAALLQAIGPGGHVTGLDLRPEFVVEAARIAEEAGLSGQVSFRQGDVSRLPFAEDSFDWVWSANCVGYGWEEPLPLVMEVVRVVRPGGTVALLIWSSEMLLPGYPVLEARLRGTSSGIAPFTDNMSPQSHWLCALGWLQEAGLRDARAQTFVGDAHAPLSDDMRKALVSLFDMRWMKVESELTPEDWTEYQRLCLPESPDFIVDRPDYYAFWTESLFHGKVAK